MIGVVVLAAMLLAQKPEPPPKLILASVTTTRAGTAGLGATGSPVGQLVFNVKEQGVLFMTYLK